MEQFHKSYFDSEIGIIELVCDGEAMIALNIVNHSNQDNCSRHNCILCQNAIQQLQEYFSGTRTEFDLPLKLDGSKLQISVWNYLRKVPYGKTVSYSEAASAVNCKSVRATATVVGKNPIPIIIPCHRVIRKSGVIGKFSLVGPEVKDFLLKLEQHK